MERLKLCPLVQVDQLDQSNQVAVEAAKDMNTQVKIWVHWVLKETTEAVSTFSFPFIFKLKSASICGLLLTN